MQCPCKMLKLDLFCKNINLKKNLFYKKLNVQKNKKYVDVLLNPKLCTHIIKTSNCFS